MSWADFLDRRFASLPGWPTPQFVIALAVIGIFAFAFIHRPDDETMKGALIAGFAGAWGYYLGSSNSSARLRDTQDETLAIAKQALLALPSSARPDVTLQPGETAQAAPATPEPASRGD